MRILERVGLLAAPTGEDDRNRGNLSATFRGPRLGQIGPACLHTTRRPGAATTILPRVGRIPADGVVPRTNRSGPTRGGNSRPTPRAATYTRPTPTPPARPTRASGRVRRCASARHRLFQTNRGPSRDPI